MASFGMHQLDTQDNNQFVDRLGLSKWLRALSALSGYPNLLSKRWYWVHFISPITPDPVDLAPYSGL